MSQEKVEIVRRLHDKWGEGDLRGGVEFYDPRVQFIPLARGCAVIRREQFADRKDALEAVGLSEQDAHRDS